MQFKDLLWKTSNSAVGDAIKDFLSLRYYVSILKYKENLLHANVKKVSTGKCYDVIIFPENNPSCTCAGFLEHKKVCKHIIIATLSILFFY